MNVKSMPTTTSLLCFYTNKTPLLPDGVYLNCIHRKWKGRYNLLEKHHGFIQWLFPTQKPSLHNPKAPHLTLNVARAMAANPIVRENFLKPYQMMLDFHRMRLIDKARGTIIRNPRNWKGRYHNLLHNFHNRLRITRILTSLGEVMGWEHYKFQLIRHLAAETFLKNGALKPLKSTVLDHWIKTLHTSGDQKVILDLISSRITLKHAYQKADSDKQEGKRKGDIERQMTAQKKEPHDAQKKRRQLIQAENVTYRYKWE